MKTVDNTEKFLCSWKHGTDIWKLFEIPRDAIDDDSDERYPAHNVIKIDSSGIRRYDDTFDLAYCRHTKLHRQMVDKILETCDDPKARTILGPYSAEATLDI